MLEDVFVRKLPKFAIAAFSVAAIAGTAAATTRHNHVMDVTLPDGAIARVEYAGNIAPKVTIEPAIDPDADWVPLPAFAGFDRMIAAMNRESEAMISQAQQSAHQPAGGMMPNFASLTKAPAGMTSMTVISYSNGSGTCTRTTQSISQGPGKAPLIKSSLSGNCGAPTAPAAPSVAPVSRT